MKQLTTFLLLLLSITAIAQDRVIKINSDTIRCKVTELAASEVKYYYAENPKLIFGIDKALVDRVEFATGEVVSMEANSFANPEYYANQAKHALKINFLSPLAGSTEFAYEQNIKPGRSWEMALGIIGLGIDVQDINPRGVYGKFAYKLIKRPDFYMSKMHYAHILKGAYLAPEIAVRIMSYDDHYYYYSTNSNSGNRENSFGLALTLKFGKQWVINDSFLVDVYGGVGYGFGGDEYITLHYGFISGTEDFPMAATGGIRIGWVF